MQNLEQVPQVGTFLSMALAGSLLEMTGSGLLKFLDLTALNWGPLYGK